jgi:hypothetical protein
MKYTKTLIFGLIAMVMVTTGCATGGSTAVTVYDKDGNAVQKTSKDGVMLNAAYNAAAECNKAQVQMAQRSQLGVIDPNTLKGLSPSAQTEYARSLPIMFMADALKAATSKNVDPCSQPITAFYNYKSVEKQANTQLWSKGLGILGFIGGAAVIGNSVEGIVGSIANSTGGGSYNINGSRVNMDSGNNYSSPGGYANASSSGDGLGSSNSFPRQITQSGVYGGNQPRGTTTQMDDQNGAIDFGSNSGNNAPQGIAEVPEVPEAPAE